MKIFTFSGWKTNEPIRHVTDLCPLCSSFRAGRSSLFPKSELLSDQPTASNAKHLLHDSHRATVVRDGWGQLSALFLKALTMGIPVPHVGFWGKRKRSQENGTYSDMYFGLGIKAANFKLDECLKPTKYPTPGEWVNKMRLIRATEHCPAKPRNKLLTHATHLRITVLNESSQTQNTTWSYSTDIQFPEKAKLHRQKTEQLKTKCTEWGNWWGWWKGSTLDFGDCCTTVQIYQNSLNHTFKMAAFYNTQNTSW